AAIGAGHREVVTMHVDGVVGHGEICDTHPHAIALAHRQMIDAGEDTRVKGPEIEVEHLGDLGQKTAGIDAERSQHEHKVAIDAHERWIARMHDEHPHHAHGHLHHLVGVRVVHEGSALGEHELVNECPSRHNVRLGHAPDAIHAARHEHAVPVHG